MLPIFAGLPMAFGLTYILDKGEAYGIFLIATSMMLMAIHYYIIKQ